MAGRWRTRLQEIGGWQSQMEVGDGAGAGVGASGDAAQRLHTQELEAVGGDGEVAQSGSTRW